MSKCIKCEWKNNGRVIVNPDGQVWPCCYLSNHAYKYDITNQNNIYEKEKKSKNNHIMKDYFENKNDNNIFTKSLDEILSSKWFNETLPKSWENYEDAYYKCKKYCTVEKKDD